MSMLNAFSGALLTLAISISVHADGRMLGEGRRFTEEAKTYGEGLDEYEEWQRNGLRYRIYYGDASAKFATAAGDALEDTRERWHCACEKDAMDDFVLCYAKIHDLLVVLNGGGEWSVRVAGSQHNYPGREVAIRVGDGKPFRASDEDQFSKEISKKIVALFEDGQEVTTRYTAWPDGIYVDKTWTIQGFGLVSEYLKWAINQID